MIQICPQCGTVNNQALEVCPFCEAPFDTPPPEHSSNPASSGEPEWRREVARRLEVYRARRHRPSLDDTQTILPFHPEESVDEPSAEGAEIATTQPPRAIARIRPVERVEIHVAQPQLDFSIVENFVVQGGGATTPVARLSSRRWAGCLDAAILAAVFLGFLGMFRSMGGQLSMGKIDVGIYAAAFFLLYGLYFSLFTLFSGVTPGMQIWGLRVTALDGNFPETRQLAWRSFGYVLSGGTLLLGFLWALWDEEHLTWQDRLSQTYVTVREVADTEDGDAGDASPHDPSSFLHKHTVA